MANIQTSGSMTVSSRGGKTVYESDSDIYVNGKNVGRHHEVTGQNSGSVIAGGDMTIFGGSRNNHAAGEAGREAGRKAREAGRQAREAGKKIREQAKLHKKMHGY